MNPEASALVGAIVGSVLSNAGWWFAEWTRFRFEAARDRRRRELGQ